ncbi:hypothetical protein M426DRAFT_23394 [Hypoxylon sp. CI-4A]|nr:hypothetical protein M426DRAFT_23394 [Hypoxylon sp. CI-4A]
MSIRIPDRKAARMLSSVARYNARERSRRSSYQECPSPLPPSCYHSSTRRWSTENNHGSVITREEIMRQYDDENAIIDDEDLENDGVDVYLKDEGPWNTTTPDKGLLLRGISSPNRKIRLDPGAKVPRSLESRNFLRSLESKTRESRESSLDSDLFSVSDSSSDAELPFFHDDLYLELTDLVRGLVVDYPGAAIGEQAHNENRTAPTAIPGNPDNTPSLPLGTYRKRSRAQKNNEGSGDEEFPLPPPRRIKQGARDNRQRSLACPFAKSDPRKHHACFSKRLTRIRDVKQHLARKHTPEHYCIRCSAIFPNQEDLRAHVGNAEGLFCVPSSSLDGISQQKHLQLSRKSNPKLPEDGQWFSIWDIIFPGQKRPSSAYMDFGFSEDLCSYREYSRNRAVAAVVGGLQLNELVVTRDEPQEVWDEVRRVVADSLDSVYDDWRSDQSSRLTAASSTPFSNRPGTSSQPTQQSSTPATSEDSGIDLMRHGAFNKRRSSSRPSINEGPMVTHEESGEARSQIKLGTGESSYTDSNAIYIDDSENFESWLNNSGISTSNYDLTSEHDPSLDFLGLGESGGTL